jgi:hypothetical protein
LRMKNKLLGIALVLSLAALVFVLIGCPEKGQISKGKYGITIRPKQGGYPKLEAKWADIQSVLNDYPYLYYIEQFKDGDLVAGPRGNSCNLFPLANLEQVKKEAKETVPPYTGHAVQIGIGLSKVVEDSECLGGDNCPEDETLESHSPQAHYHKYLLDSKEMTKRVNEILNGSDAAGSTPGG